MSYRLFIDSDNGLSIDPEYEYDPADAMFSDESTTPKGNMYRYIYGTKEDYRVPVKYVNSNFMSIVNSWWKSGALLLYKSESETAVYSVQIVNNKTPITKRVKPYDDLFEGKIELKGY